MQRYTAADRQTRFAGLRLAVFKGVFHPGLFFSTRTFWHYLNTLPLSGEPLLEVGSGSGALALAAARKGAIVTASDISPEAIRCMTHNAQANGVAVRVVQSDLFTALPADTYTWIIVNPPFYPRDPKTAAEHAWYCGEGHTYFKTFFAGASAYLRPGGAVLMVLSDDCDLETILDMARKAGWEHALVYERRLLLERNFIYRFRSLGNGDLPNPR